MHLYLSDYAHPLQEAVFALNPKTAIELLSTGVITEVRFAEDWCGLYDPTYAVLRFIDQGVRECRIPMVGWADYGNDEVVQTTLTKLDEHCRQRGEALPMATGIQRYADACGLSPAQIFETFVCNEDNAAAYGFATLASVACRPERNPLLIIGPEGSGKSHLINAIGHRWLSFAADAKVLLIKASAFLSPENLNRELVTQDLLLIEDLQDVVGHSIAQDLIRVTGETLRTRGCQLVLSMRGEDEQSIYGLGARIQPYLAEGVSVLCASTWTSSCRDN